MIRLLRYRPELVSLRPWSARAGHAAAALAAQIRRAAPELAPEHIGSSAVPGLAGKGYLDLQAAVAPERMGAVTDDLACAGWQRQTGAHAFPPERPMLRAALDYEGERFQA